MSGAMGSRPRWTLALAAGLVVASCDDVSVHILSGQQYTSGNPGCVTSSAGVDVVAGPSTGDNCSPECIYATGNSQTLVYVTTVCPPYPGDYTTEALDAAEGDADPCFGALAAYEAFEDAGTVCAPPATDAATDAPADAPTDAPEETGDDAGD